jgi:hypothetical protein
MKSVGRYINKFSFALRRAFKSGQDRLLGKVALYRNDTIRFECNVLFDAY